MSLIDRQMPEYDVAEVHATDVHATPAVLWPVVRSLDLSGSRIIRVLFALRGLPQASLRLDGMHRVGFRVLEDAPAGELVLGLIGRFWRLGERPLAFDPATFRAWLEPGFAKAAWNFTLEPLDGGTTRLRTETRVQCTDAASRRAFLRYWRLIRPFSGVIRRETLRGMRASADVAMLLHS
jgi:hypothetical protein